MMKVARIVGALLSLSLVLAACGGADNDGGSGGSGKLATGPGFDGKTITLGILSPLSGPVAVIGEPLTAGNQVFFKALNAKGGIDGKYKVKLDTEDTIYESDTTVQKYNKIKNDVVLFTQMLGTAPTLATLPSLKRDKITAAPASLDAFWVREPNLLPVGGPYQTQAINAIDYYVAEGGGKGKRVCFMGNDDAYGEAGLQGVEFAAKENGFELASTQKLKSGDKDVTGQIQRLARAKCDAVFLTSLPSDTGTILGTAAKLKFAPRWILQSPAWIGPLADSPLKPYLEQTTWVASEGPEWGDRSVPGMKAMLDDIDRIRPEQKPDYYFSFGYVQGQAVESLLKKAVELGDLSREGIQKALREMENVESGGLFGEYDYGPAAERKPPVVTTIFKVNTSKPISLEALKRDHTSDAASKFEFTVRAGT
ncbi:MAG: ABC transporter substrate-binding protein [Solirubrobacteraceae bacterium]